jgi:hypothetical protein
MRSAALPHILSDNRFHNDIDSTRILYLGYRTEYEYSLVVSTKTRGRI